MAYDSGVAPATTYDLIVRNGTIVDGLGGEPVVGDVAVSDGVIAAVGSVDGEAAREIDATGLLVTPGFVDLHTHYDGQAIWSDRMTPSSAHGVTTAVMGNCGVGFAPCRASRPRGACRRDGGRGGHPRRGDGRRAAVDVGDLPRVHGCTRSGQARHRRRRVPAALAAARLRDGSARRRPRTRHARGPGTDAQAGGRGDRRRCTRLRVVAADDPQDRKRPTDSELRRRPRRDRGDRPWRRGRGRRAASSSCPTSSPGTTSPRCRRCSTSPPMSGCRSRSRWRSATQARPSSRTP